MGQPARLPRKLLRFLTVSREERRDLVDAFRAILWARRVMRDRPTGELVALYSSADAPNSRRPAAPSPPAVDLPRARSVAEAVVRVAAYMPFDASCLIRSLAIQRMYRARGLETGQIKIGVALDGKAFLAHAWVEVDGRVMGDTVAHVSRFTPVTDMTAVRF